MVPELGCRKVMEITPMETPFMKEKEYGGDLNEF